MGAVEGVLPAVRVEASGGCAGACQPGGNVNSIAFLSAYVVESRLLFDWIFSGFVVWWKWRAI